ncbi:hypothetical protein GCM10020331_012860 [Ectobacillus funiculus]
MALVDKLNQVKKSEESPNYQVPLEKENEKVIQLVKELQRNLEDNQKKLMDILKGYVSVQMDKQAVAKVTMEQELAQIKGTSETVQQGMISILKKSKSCSCRGAA